MVNEVPGFPVICYKEGSREYRASALKYRLVSSSIRGEQRQRSVEREDGKCMEVNLFDPELDELLSEQAPQIPTAKQAKTVNWQGHQCSRKSTT